MREFPPIGARVRYVGEWWPLEGVTGVVVEYYRHFDDDTLRWIKDPELEAVKVVADNPDSNFPYSSGSFAPSLSEIEIISDSKKG